jgi:hypothetical protein
MAVDPTITLEEPWSARTAQPDTRRLLTELPHRVSERLKSDAFPIILVSCLAMVWMVQLRMQVAADSWLNLLGGREIVRHGVPHHDMLAVLSNGRHWIDEQWLANLFFYGIYRVGGMPLVAHVNVLIFVSSVALTFSIARRRGASAATVAICGISVALMAHGFIRAEVLVQPLFVLVVALLMAESRRPTRRVFLAFPILVLWANLHGSVLVAAAFVALLGATEAVPLLRRRVSTRGPIARAAVLLTAPWLCVFASPYGLTLVSYYRATAGNPEFSKFLGEWRSPAPMTLWGFALILAITLAAFAIVRRPRELTFFELGALVITLFAAITAARSIVWFSYATALILPQLLTRRREARTSVGSNSRELFGAAALVACVGAAIVIGRSFISPPAAVAHDLQRQALPSIQRVLRGDPSARVFASYDLADWILFRVPEARGRVAYDGRWEILRPAEMAQLVRYLRKEGADWDAPSSGYRLLVLNPKGQQEVVAAYSARKGLRTLYRDRNVVVFDRGAANGQVEHP